MDPAQAAALLDGLRALVQSAAPAATHAHPREDTMNTTAACESCGTPIETGRYCSYCTDEKGQLQSFEDRFTRMTAWQARRNPGTSREEIERQTLEYMATMPAWRDHPRVTSRAC
jgi:hypothetical protein